MSWKQISEELAAAVTAIEPSIVRVEGHRREPGTGIVWADGVVVTTHHALGRDGSVRVGRDDDGVDGEVVGRDPSTDLAVVRASLPGAAAATWAEASALAVGQFALAVARPGRRPRASFGIVRALGEPFRTGDGGRVDRWIETDAALDRGFEGSALIDASGRVVGVGTTALRCGRALATPGDTVRRVVEALLAKGRIERGFLGVGTLPVRLPEVLERELGQRRGLLVLNVQPESPAQAAGLVLGDVIVRFDGRPLRHPGELVAQLDGERIGQATTLLVVRAGATKEIGLTIGARAA